jgi:putative transcriptional regulator
MVRCRLSDLMGRDKLRVADVARLTGLNRSTVTALYKETATRVDLPTIEALCKLFRCEVGDLLLIVPDKGGGTR